MTLLFNLLIRFYFYYIQQSIHYFLPFPHIVYFSCLTQLIKTLQDVHGEFFFTFPIQLK